MLRSWRTISFRSAFPGLSVCLSPLMHRPSQMFLCFHDTERFNGCVTKGSPTLTARFPVISSFTSKWSLQKGNTNNIGGRRGMEVMTLYWRAVSGLLKSVISEVKTDARDGSSSVFVVSVCVWMHVRTLNILGWTRWPWRTISFILKQAPSLYELVDEYI